MTSKRVLQENQPGDTSSFRPLTKAETKSLVAAGLQRRVGVSGLDTVAGELGCTTKTVRMALAHDSLLEADKLGNLLARDPSALFEWFDRLGLHVSYRDTELSPGMQTLLHMSEAVTEFIHVLQDKRRDHRETIKLAELFRPLLPRLSAIVSEADAIKNGGLRIVA